MPTIDVKEKRAGMAERDMDDTRKEGWLKRTISRLGSDDLFRESFFNCIGAFVNLVLAVINGYSGYVGHNPWSQSMAFYFLVLGLITLYVAFCFGRPQGRSARLVMKQCGVCLIILGIAVASLMYLYIIGHELMVASVGILWAITVLTVVLAVLAIYNTYRLRGSDPVRRAFQRVTLSASIGAIGTLEIQLLATLGQGLDPTFVTAIETISALIAAALLVIFGISLLKQAKSVEDVTM